MGRRNYFNLDEAEIDNILMIILFPKRRDRMNFSDRGTFEDILMPEIVKRECQHEFVSNLENIHDVKRGKNKIPKSMMLPNERLQYQYELIFSPPKYLKLAVLITIDEDDEE